mmetsp:Transcript_34596/g.103376  ORF Transcript_34596/g.103376 Transcript_34596/m.103376 type:complete len:120 (-) Transcript_34596:460-819(-)
MPATMPDCARGLLQHYSLHRGMHAGTITHESSHACTAPHLFVDLASMQIKRMQQEHWSHKEKRRQDHRLSTCCCEPDASSSPSTGDTLGPIRSNFLAALTDPESSFHKPGDGILQTSRS